MAGADPTVQKHHCLHFLSGKNQGAEYVLVDPGEAVVGRSQEADIAMVEGMVSRRHARFCVRNDVFTLEDLGSTNGTFVNGDRVKHRVLSPGDRILIGTTIMRVERTANPAGTSPPPRPHGPSIVEADTTSREVMSGELDQMGVPELVEMFATARQPLLLEVDTLDDLGRLYIEDGTVLDGHSRRLGDEAPAEKVLLRIFSFQRGSFALRPFTEPPQRRLNRGIPETLVDALFKLDELEVLRQKLPEMATPVSLSRPMKPRLRALADRDLDLLQLAHNAKDLAEVFDASPLDDLDVARGMLALFDGGYLRRG
ncbi:MAG: FHA domain-containing protein [Myxococcota bacterium]